MAQTHPLEHLEAILVVGIGGFAGSNLRYFIDLFVPSSLAATASVNILGCFALGFLIYEELFSGTISGTSRTLMATGFLASFTTYSTFIIDVLTTTPTVAIGYIIGSYALGFGAVLLGREAARWVSTVTPSAPEVDE
ncbi:fluoride efflux transporter FluC [Haladaptatus halobius]|uniref:fluoride efflux transporter FluC n=1 Tax=Haladaptatus halobius TaxID=2884875 RepID=UPI001D09ED50|nr:CrcB family protein [Haladaptatus halobius]